MRPVTQQPGPGPHSMWCHSDDDAWLFGGAVNNTTDHTNFNIQMKKNPIRSKPTVPLPPRCSSFLTHPTPHTSHSGNALPTKNTTSQCIMGQTSTKVDMGIAITNPQIPDATVVGFQMIGGCGTLFAACYYAIRAYSSKTGPTLGNGTFMRDYSGHFEVRPVLRKQHWPACLPERGAKGTTDDRAAARTTY